MTDQQQKLVDELHALIFASTPGPYPDVLRTIQKLYSELEATGVPANAGEKLRHIAGNAKYVYRARPTNSYWDGLKADVSVLRSILTRGE